MEAKGGLSHVLDQIEREKGIKRDDILKMIEHALVSAYRKHAGEGVIVEAHVDLSGEVSAVVVKTIVEKMVDPLIEISIEEAQKIDENAAVGGQVRYPIDTEEFGRIAAQTVKQVLTQKIRETEREFVYTEFKPKEGTLVNGSVHRFVSRNIVVDLGRAEGILAMKDQVRREHWAVGERIRVLIQRVEKGPRGPEIILSRAHEDFVKRLFEQEVPEIYEKTVQVMAVVREPGQRSKVVVKSSNSKIDPIGACVGVKGSRVRPIINELQGERIDLVAFSTDPASYIAAALAPAKPMAVHIIDPDRKRAEALVTDDMLALAIGKNGQNVRLASKLTGWEIDIKTESQKKAESAASLSTVRDMLIELEGVGPRTADVLIKGGMNNLGKIALSSVEDLTVFAGIGEKLAEKIISSAKEYLEKLASQPAPAPIVLEPSIVEPTTTESTPEVAKE
ncbi:MAG: transcription termination factor NusA [Elusimicrobiota bacterium]